MTNKGQVLALSLILIALLLLITLQSLIPPYHRVVTELSLKKNAEIITLIREAIIYALRNSSTGNFEEKIRYYLNYYSRTIKLRNYTVSIIFNSRICRGIIMVSINASYYYSIVWQLHFNNVVIGYGGELVYNFTLCYYHECNLIKIYPNIYSTEVYVSRLNSTHHIVLVPISLKEFTITDSFGARVSIRVRS